MLVWINGPFGGGKTATAYELERRLPGSVVCDPEHLGFGLRRMIPAALTLVDLGYFAEIIGRLRDDGHDVRHFALPADRATVLRRLSRRGFGYGLKREGWAVSRLDDCLARLREPEFAEHIHTDQRTVPQVADTIARRAALPIRPDTDGPPRGSLRRYATTLRNVRFD